MLNQFKVRLLVILVTSVAFIFSFSQIGANTYSAISSGETFAKGTKIASINVEGMTKDAAISKVASEVEVWNNTGEIHFVFGTLTETVSKKDTLTFLIEESVNVSKNGIDNPLHVGWNTPIETIESVSSKKITSFNEEALQTEVRTAASTLQAGNIELDLVSFLNIGDSVVVSSSVINLDENNHELNEWIKQSKVIPLKPNQVFSLQKYVEEIGFEGSNKTLSIIATGIYETILPSNFEVVERQSSEYLPSYAKLGFEAGYRAGKDDLMIFNTNPFEYLLTFNLTDQGLVVELKGPDFPNEYRIELIEEETIKPKTIKQYDSSLAFGSSRVKVEGGNGSFVKVKRITLLKGKEIESVILTEDYYSPVHKVVQVSLKSNATLDPDTTPEDTDTSEIDDDTIDNTTENDTENEEDEEIGTGEDFWEEPEEMK